MEREKGTVKFCGERHVVVRKCCVKNKMTCFLCTPCETLYVLALCLCIYLFGLVYSIRGETVTDAQRVPVGVFTFYVLVSCVSLVSRCSFKT